MNKAEGEELALALLAAGESAHAFSAFLPSRFTIRNWVLDASQGAGIDANIANLRSGYGPSIALGLGLGGVISLLAKSALPLLFAAGTSLAMLRLYEDALPADKRLEPLGYLTLLGRGAPQRSESPRPPLQLPNWTPI